VGASRILEQEGTVKFILSQLLVLFLVYVQFLNGITLTRSQVPCRPTGGSKYATIWKELELGAAP
jgi:hypothetical protein